MLPLIDFPEDVRAGTGGVGRGRRPRFALIAAAALAFVASPTGRPTAAEDPPDAPAVRFRAEPIPGFLHRSGAAGRRYIVETMGSGLVLADLDGDDDLDLLLIDGAPIEAEACAAAPPRPRLLANRGDGTFEDRTEGSGIAFPVYGMGAALGDVDGDDDPDLVLTGFGAVRLFRNDGDLRFTDTTEGSGLEPSGWSTSAAFLDAEGDGDLDLYICRYVDFTVATHRECSLGRDIPTYCSPSAYGGVADRLYRNRGDGTFEEVGAAAGIADGGGKGLGVVTGDLDGDGTVDIYVANDGTVNRFFRGRGDGTFEDRTLVSGTGYNEDGRTEAGMGIAAGDVDGDGAVDLLVTHLSSETHTLYRGEGDGYFRDATSPAGLAGPSLAMTGFGTAFEDVDRDGALDLLVANGHVIDNIAEFGDLFSYPQRDQLFLGDGGGRFVDARDWLGGDATPGVGRGLATGDVDGDGDIDVVVTQTDGPALLLRNVSALDRHWLQVRLRGPRGNREAYGVRVTVLQGDRTLARTRWGGGSYLSATESDLWFGLGDVADPVELEVRWPDGAVERHEAVAIDRRVLLRPGEAPR